MELDEAQHTNGNVRSRSTTWYYRSGLKAISLLKLKPKREQEAALPLIFCVAPTKRSTYLSLDKYLSRERALFSLFSTLPVKFVNLTQTAATKLTNLNGEALLAHRHCFLCIGCNRLFRIITTKIASKLPSSPMFI